MGKTRRDSHQRRTVWTRRGDPRRREVEVVSHRGSVPCVSLTFSGQHGDADARVTEFDEGQAARHPILLSDQKDILGTNISMNEVLILLRADTTK